MKHKTIFSTTIIITCILIIFFAIVIGFGIWFLNSDNETEADLQWKRKTINDCINQTSQNYDEIRELVCDPGSDVALLGHDYDLLSKLTNLETITIVGISDASDAQNFFEELTKLKKLTSVNIVDSPIGSIRKLADIRSLSSLCIRSNPDQGARIKKFDVTDKIASDFFMMFCRGRKDVYDLRYTNPKTGKNGYYTQCFNRWDRGCHIQKKDGVRCKDCELRAP